MAGALPERTCVTLKPIWLAAYSPARWVMLPLAGRAHGQLAGLALASSPRAFTSAVPRSSRHQQERRLAHAGDGNEILGGVIGHLFIDGLIDDDGCVGAHERGRAVRRRLQDGFGGDHSARAALCSR